MKIADVMIRDPVVVKPDASCRRIAQLMRDNKIGSVIVSIEEKPVGVVTERDLVHRVMAGGMDPKRCFASEVMTKPVVAVGVHGDVDLAVDMMNEYKIRRMVIVDNKDKVVGILTTDDLAKNLRSMSEELAVKYMILARRTK